MPQRRFLLSRLAVGALLVGWLPGAVVHAHGKLDPAGASLLGPDFFDSFLSAGPTAGGLLMVSGHRTTGAATLGLEISIVDHPGRTSLRDPNGSLGLDAGYAFSDRRGFVDVHVAAGFWLVSGGVVLSPSFGRGGGGLSAGPVLIGHWRLGGGAVQHEIQIVARCDVAIMGPTADRFQLTLGLRFVFDLAG